MRTMMTRTEFLSKWAARRAKAKALRDSDPVKWTYRQIGEKFGVSAERVRQWIKKEKANGTDHRD